MNGRKVSVLADENQTQGQHQIQWSSKQKGFLKPVEGIYICKITTSGKTEVVKLLVQNK
ncbi:MAG: hypothetical protein C0397_09610 [Odoribacter sp.]|nr:hypothetical protein [Odoribacter sp.]